MRPKISAIVLAKNEEDRIEKCLVSLSWVDECIVVDNDSRDQTVKIAKKNKAKVITETRNDFSRLRNIGKNAATGDWLLYVDADEQVTPDLRKRLESIVETFLPEKDPHGYFLKRKNIYLGYAWPYQDKMQRFFWKQSLGDWKGELHETAHVDGAVETIDEPLFHDTHRILEEMVEKTNTWSRVESRLRLEAGHPPVVWWRFLRVMATEFWEYFVHQGGWRVGTVGWIESIYQAFSIFITYAKLWELQQKEER